MTCPRCAELEAEVKELNAALEGAIWPNDAHAKIVATALRLSMQQAHAVVALHKAKGGLRTSQLSEFLPTYNGEDRATDYGSVVIHHIRKRLGQEFVASSGKMGCWGQVYSLSPVARGVVGALLGAAA